MFSRIEDLRSPAGLALLVVLTVFVLKVFVAVGIGLDGDEAYYTLWSAYLSAGYLDHPPGIALVVALGRWLAGDSPLGVRLIPLLSSLATSAALFRTGLVLFPRSSAAAIAVIWYTLCLLTATNLVATPDAPSTLFWVLAVWAAAEAVAARRPHWWLAVGLFAGAGLVSKYTNGFLGLGLVLFLLGTAEGRQHLRHWQLWAGGALALLIFSPVLWWNATHGWRSFLFQGARLAGERNPAESGNYTLEFLAGQALLVGPFLIAFAVAGLVSLALRPRSEARPGLLLLVLTSAPALLYFVAHSFHSHVEANWTLPIIPSLALVGAWAALALTPASGPLRFLSIAARVLQPLLGGALVLLVIVQALFHPLSLGSLDRTAKLRDWGGLYAGVQHIADAAGAQQIWTNGDYALTGELFSYSLFARDGRAIRDLSGHPRYDFMPPLDGPAITWPSVYVQQASTRREVKPPEGMFRSVVPAGTVERRQGEAVLARYVVFVVNAPGPEFPASAESRDSQP